MPRGQCSRGLRAGATAKRVGRLLIRGPGCRCARASLLPAPPTPLAATDIQNIQIAEGDVCRKMAIPMHMIFPRLFTCPTVAAKNFKVEFEVNVVVLLQDGHLITENFPIRIVRTGTSSAPALV